MIREATPDDIPVLVGWGEAFFNENKDWPAPFVFDRDFLAKGLTEIINSESSMIFIGNGGAVGAIIYPHYFTGQLTGQELFWWVQRASRGGGEAIKLLRKIERWAAEKGALTFTMISLEGLSPERVGKLYTRLGYRPIEHSYTKDLQ